MKTRSTFVLILFAATVSAFLTNCSGNQKEDATHSHAEHAESEHASPSNTVGEASQPQFEVDQKFQKQLGSFFSSYVDLKEAFVEGDARRIKSQASETKAALAHVDMKLVTGAAHNDWMAYLNPIQNSLSQIQSADDIDTQRKAFSTLSDNLYKSVKAFGLGGKEAFYEYCPMAFDNEGAYWLSDKETIRNPYFGDKMLACGEVKERLK